MNEIELEENKLEIKLIDDKLLSVGEIDPIDNSVLKLPSKLYRFEDVDARAYKAKDIMLVIRSSDDIIFQADIKSKNRQTRRSHVMLKVELFDRIGLRILEWNPSGNIGVSCRQDDIRQFNGNFAEIFRNTSLPEIEFSRHSHVGC